MTTRLLSRLLIVLGLMVAALAAIADQSGNPTGAHEIPRFVRERVELPSGAPDDRPDSSDGVPASQPGCFGSDG